MHVVYMYRKTYRQHLNTIRYVKRDKFYREHIEQAAFKKRSVESVSTGEKMQRKRQPVLAGGGAHTHHTHWNVYKKPRTKRLSVMRAMYGVRVSEYMWQDDGKRRKSIFWAAKYLYLMTFSAKQKVHTATRTTTTTLKYFIRANYIEATKKTTWVEKYALD